MKLLVFFILFFTQGLQAVEKSEQKFPEIQFSLENSLNLKKDQLLNSWAVEIPYMELGVSYRFLEDISLQAEMDISFKKASWSYSIDHLSMDQKFSHNSHLKWGYFPYPVSYFVKYENLFSKELETQTALFPEGSRALGLLFKQDLFLNTYLQVSAQFPSNLITTTQSPSHLKLSPALSASLFYEKNTGSLFLSYFEQEFFLEGRARSLGVGTDIVCEINSLKLGFRGEFWLIHTSWPREIELNYYGSPFLKWNRLSVQTLYGRRQIRQAAHFLEEYIVRLAFDITKNIQLNWEFLQEQDSIIKTKSTSLSVRTKF